MHAAKHIIKSAQPSFQHVVETTKLELVLMNTRALPRKFVIRSTPPHCGFAKIFNTRTLPAKCFQIFSATVRCFRAHSRANPARNCVATSSAYVQTTIKIAPHRPYPECSDCRHFLDRSSGFIVKPSRTSTKLRYEWTCASAITQGTSCVEFCRHTEVFGRVYFSGIRLH